MQGGIAKSVFNTCIYSFTAKKITVVPSPDIQLFLKLSLSSFLLQRCEEQRDALFITFFSYLL